MKKHLKSDHIPYPPERQRETQMRAGYALSLQEDRTDDVSLFVSVINETNGKAETVTDHIKAMNE